MRDQVPAVPLQVFHHPEYAPDQYQRATGEQSVEVASPGDHCCDRCRLHGGGGGNRHGEGAAEPEEDGDADSHKTAEERNLHEETDNDDLLAEIVEVEGAARLGPRARGLHCERHNVARNEDPGQPAHGYG